jgi:Holliday junction DNA helicase RuvA
MIGTIRGKVGAHGTDWLNVETAGGVGYRINATNDTITSFPPGSEVSLLTNLIVREDQLTLYGFQIEAELNFFTQLIAVSGVGPRMALAILNAGKVGDIKAAVASNNLAILTTISGIGAKTAERIMVELRGKVGPSDDSLPSDAEDLLVALTSFGYNSYEVRRILPSIPNNLATTEEKVKHALQLLSR